MKAQAETIERIPNSPSPATSRAPAASETSRRCMPLDSDEIKQWLAVRILGLLMAQDMEGRPSAAVTKDQYIQESAGRIRSHVIQAIRIGDISIRQEQIDELCKLAATEAYAVRSLKEARASGRISKRKMRRLPLYRRYQDFLDDSPKLLEIVANALVIDCALDHRRSEKSN
jgi:hypothetical protein